LGEYFNVDWVINYPYVNDPQSESVK